MELEVKDSTQRVLDVAEALFMDRGYNAITLRDIADELGIKQASLYYHFPDGKEQLFMAMAERLFERHREGLESALAKGEGNLRTQLVAAANWFGSQRPVKLLGMMHADLQALSPEHKQALTQLATRSIHLPLRRAIADAEARGEIRSMQLDMVAGSFLWLMDGLNYGQMHFSTQPRTVITDEFISLLMDGLRPRLAETDRSLN